MVNYLIASKYRKKFRTTNFEFKLNISINNTALKQII